MAQPNFRKTIKARRRHADAVRRRKDYDGTLKSRQVRLEGRNSGVPVDQRAPADTLATKSSKTLPK